MRSKSGTIFRTGPVHYSLVHRDAMLVSLSQLSETDAR